jgi:RNA polymerase sigma-70 factor, ECF subfamily
LPAVTLAAIRAKQPAVDSTGPDEPGANDAALLQRVQQGDVEAFAPVVRRHLPSLRAFVALHLPVPHLADEVAHETFVFAFRHIQEFHLHRPFRPWLRGIAWNLVRAELQRFAREQVNRSRLEQLQLAELQAGLAQPTPPDEAGFLEECLGELPLHLRRLIEDRYRHEQTAGQIAANWGRTEQWVRVTLFRARRQLRSCIESKLEGASHVT